MWVVIEFLERDYPDDGAMPSVGDLTVIRADGIIHDLEAAEDIARHWLCERRHRDSKTAVLSVERLLEVEAAEAEVEDLEHGEQMVEHVQGDQGRPLRVVSLMGDRK